VRKHELPSPILQSGTSIAQGEGTFLTLMVGEDSCLGQIMAQMEKRDEKTPLQEKLEEMAEDIGKLGTVFAILTFHVLMIRFIVEGLIFKQINLFGTVPMSARIKTYK
jgi:magnesium-transporting ATPase (P-type)